MQKDKIKEVGFGPRLAAWAWVFNPHMGTQSTAYSLYDQGSQTELPA